MPRKKGKMKNNVIMWKWMRKRVWWSWLPREWNLEFVEFANVMGSTLWLWESWHFLSIAYTLHTSLCPKTPTDKDHSIKKWIFKIIIIIIIGFYPIIWTNFGIFLVKIELDSHLKHFGAPSNHLISISPKLNTDLMTELMSWYGMMMCIFIFFNFNFF